MSLIWIKCKTCDKEFYSFGDHDLQCEICKNIDSVGFDNDRLARCPKCKKLICCDDEHESFDCQCSCGYEFYVMIDYEKTITSPDLLKEDTIDATY